MSGRRGIPRVPPTDDGERRAFDEAVKERLELIAGLRGGKINKLPATATTAEIVAKVNELVALLQQ